MERYDAIVLGIGGVGSAALYHLARRGVRAIGIDRFNPPHDRGSSHGQTRVIRQAYFEHSDYVPLLREAYGLWRDLESLARTRLFYQIGLVEVGPPEGVVVPGVLRAADQHQLRVESLTGQQIERRWPGLRIAKDFVGVFEAAAGYLCVERCVQAHIDAARAAGAEIITDTEVQSWTAEGGEVRLQTTGGHEIVGARLIIAAGAWASRMLIDLNVALNVRRKSLFWFASDDSRYDVASGMPVFLFEEPEGAFYGFPQIDERGVKFAEHTGGRTVDDPLVVDRSIDVSEQSRLIEALTRYLPGVSSRVTDHVVCLYTMSPDEHFIVDRHPSHANVVFAAGLSGHGFKFTPVLGKLLADMAVDGGTDLPIEFLSLNRFAAPHEAPARTYRDGDNQE
jgi:monomeric sarcosine oxidase